MAAFNYYAKVLILAQLFSGILQAEPTLAVSNATAAGPTEDHDQLVSIPVTDADGQTTQLHARVCRPAANGPSRLVIINHGSPANSAVRPRMQLNHCNEEAPQWFLSRGYVVAFALRRGYGVTGGPWAETYGRCEDADYVRAGIETARDINAVIDSLTVLPFVRPDGAIVVGQSAGGWGTIAYDSLPHAKVAAFVVMAGGRGGHLHDEPNNNCHPERLAEAAGHFGATASTPMLWIYTQNDSFFAPDLARGLYQKFTSAGGKANFQQPGSFGSEGHHLFFAPGGLSVWGPLVEHYLDQQHALGG
jgi:pimeloyl-ACP methyl ester carboxylesterase